jgi:hypothetical protein
MSFVLKIIETLIWLAAQLTVLTVKLTIGLILGFVNLLSALFKARAHTPPSWPEAKSPNLPPQTPPPSRRRPTHWLD